MIREGFYDQFKKNLNQNHLKIIDGYKDNELYGLLNIAMNHKFLDCIWQDLKMIYKIVFKNTEVIEFKTIVDLFSACAKFISIKTDILCKRTNSNFE